MTMTNIWDEIICKPSLMAAFEKVKNNKGCAGEDGITIADFQKRLHSNLAGISRQLREGTFEQGEYSKVIIPKKSGAIRMLMIPTIRDRIVHTAIAKKLTPILEPLFENCSFAYRPGRSVKQAIAKIEYWRNDGYIYVIEADIKDYFNSIDHKRLLKTLANCFDETVQHSTLIDFLENEFSHQAKELEISSRGLVQGSPLSPLLANLYLDRLDETISEHGVKIVRFADDFVLLCKKPQKTEKALIKLQRIIASLGLELNMDKTNLVSFDEGYEFLGYMFVRSLAVKKSKEDQDQSFIQTTIDEQPVKTPKLKTSKPIPTLKTTGIARHALGDRILYVIEKGRKIHSDNSAFYISTPQGNEVMCVATNRVDRIVLGTNIDLNRDLIDHCSANNIAISFVNGWGETKARLITPEDDHAALQFAQAKACSNVSIATKLSRKIVDARIRN